MKLNLGCGGKKLEGYINIDIGPQFNPDIVGDLCDLSQFEDNSADEIRLDAAYEHIYFQKRADALREWHRVLGPGGKLAINWIPDFEALLGLYGGPGPTDGFPHFDIVMARRMLYGKAVSESSLHKDCFTARKIEQELTSAGFRRIKVSRAVFPGECPDIVYNLCVEAYV